MTTLHNSIAHTKIFNHCVSNVDDYISKNNITFTVAKNSDLTLCPDYIHRVMSTDNCPSTLRCSDGFVLCDDNTCRPSYEKCPITTICPKYTCPNGMCVDDYALCPVNIACGEGWRMCGDYQCHPRTEACPAEFDEYYWKIQRDEGKKICRGGGVVDFDELCPNHVGIE